MSILSSSRCTSSSMMMAVMAVVIMAMMSTMTTTTKTTTMMMMTFAYTPSIPRSVTQHTTQQVPPNFGELDLDSIDDVLAQAEEALKVASKSKTTITSTAKNIQLVDDEESTSVIESVTRKSGGTSMIAVGGHSSSSSSSSSTSSPSSSSSSNNVSSHRRLEVRQPQQQRIIPIDLADLVKKTDAFLTERGVDGGGSTSNVNSNIIADDNNNDDENGPFLMSKKQLVGQVIVHSGRFLWKKAQTLSRTFAKKTVPVVVEQLSAFFSSVKQNYGDGPKIQTVAKSIIGKVHQQRKRVVASLSSTSSTSAFVRFQSFLRLVPPTSKLQENVDQEQKFKSTFAVPTTTTAVHHHHFFMTEKKHSFNYHHRVTQKLSSMYEKSVSTPSSLFMKEVATAGTVNKQNTNFVFAAAQHIVRLWQSIFVPTALASSVLEGVHGSSHVDIETGAWNGSAILKWSRVPRKDSVDNLVRRGTTASAAAATKAKTVTNHKTDPSNPTTGGSSIPFFAKKI
mmetsp:Transcript_18483/g.44598  ORF Transcript_18483/g.44598 Transcript_18483/m.44598 type:complete len:508 (+) Transcript_18483:202-1725(+)